MRDGSGHIHPLATLSQERSGPCRAKERGGGAPDGGLPQIHRDHCRHRTGTALSQHAALREFLSALVQTDGEDPGWCPRDEAVSPTIDAIPARAGPSCRRTGSKDALAAQFSQLDPVILLHEIRQAQARLTALADATPFTDCGDAKENVEAFLNGLRLAWKEGEVRPTWRKKQPIPRGRRRPDPLAKVTDALKAWFYEDPSQTGRELLGRLQAAHPDDYPDELIRTVQRRVKIWRGDMARALVFGVDRDAPPLMTSDTLRNMEASRVRGHKQSTEPTACGNENPREQSAEATI